MTRDEVLAALEESRKRVEARLVPDSAERFGSWTAKDLLFHLGYWQRFYGARLKVGREAGRDATYAEMMGRTLEPAAVERLDGLDTDQLNAYLENLNRDEDWPAAIRLWRGGYELLRDEVARLSDQQLAEGEPLWRRIGLESFTHIAEHLAGPE